MLLIEFDKKQDVAEVAMNPKAYAQSMSHAAKQGVMIGFEFEVCVPNWAFETSDDEKTEVDYVDKFKDLLRYEEDRIDGILFDKLFKLSPGVTLRVRGDRREYSSMATASDAHPFAGDESAERIVMDILQSSGMWPSESFAAGFDFDPKKVDEFNKEFWDTIDHDDEDGNFDYSKVAKFLEPKITDNFGSTQVFYSYHEEDKNLTDWYIEPDGSLRPFGSDGAAEIVSPPMPAPAAMLALERFYQLADKLDLYTNESTGLHINVSVPEKIDILKLAVFLGDNYVLKQFNREDNDYARSVVDALSDPKYHHVKAAAAQLAHPEIDLDSRLSALQRLANNLSDDHMASVSDNGDYISFRHAGGNYLAEQSKIEQTVGRFVRAMLIAADPEAYKKEYLKKLIQLTGPAREAQKEPSQEQIIKNAMVLLRDMRAHGVPILEVDLVASWGEPDWSDATWILQELRNTTANIDLQRIKVAAPEILNNLKQQWPRIYQSKPNLEAVRYRLVPEGWQAAEAIVNFVKKHPHDPRQWSTQYRIVRVPLTDPMVQKLADAFRYWIEHYRTSRAKT